MAAAAAVEKAAKEQVSSAHTITFLEKKIVGHTTAPLRESKIDQFLETVAIHLIKVPEAFERIVANCDAADLPPHQREYEALIDRAMDVKCDLLAIKQSFPSTSTSSSSSGSTASSHPVDIRLPRLTLPTFDGRIEEWSSFRDMFTTAIHSSTHLSNSQKLTYLKAQLKGEAARQVQSLVVNDANYAIAWKALTDRYHNDRQLLFTILKRLLGQTPVSTASATSLRQLVDVSQECIRSLIVLAQPVQHWDSILLYTLYQKLDSSSRELYEQTLKDSSIPQLAGLFDFLEQRSRALEAGGTKSSSHQPIKIMDKPRHPFPPRNNVHHAHTNQECKACNNSQNRHPTYRCPSFVAMSVPERWELVRKCNLCFNCLRSGHILSQCPTQLSCRSCNGKHHTLLHRTLPPPPVVVSERVPTLNHHANGPKAAAQTLLATAIVFISDSQGISQAVRVLLDGGSDTHVVSMKTVKRLGLSWAKESATVTGLSSTPVGSSPGFVDIEFTPHFNTGLPILAKSTRIMSTVTTQLPLHPCDPDLPHLYGLQLADESWYQPGEVDLLLGASLFYGLIRGGKMTGLEGEPFALSSDLGWLVVGEVGQNKVELSSFHSCVKRNDNLNCCEEQQRVVVDNIDLDRRLRSFWELETIKESTPLTNEEKKCEDHFLANVSHDEDGKFTVKLPFHSSPPNLGPSRDMSVQRLKQLERRLSRDPKSKEEYVLFMKEYKSLGHMVEVPSSQVHDEGTYHIPHHFITKDTSTTTKFRVVFDASAKSRNGLSLNDNLMVGATMQDPLFNIMLRFRTHVIAFTADIAKMYRQIRVDPSDADYQRIVWREDPSLPIRDFKLLTVTYGTASAPFLATRTLQHLAKEQEVNLPLASEVALNDLFVDDCMSGADKLDDARQLQSELLELMKRGGFELRKWTSNHPDLLKSLPEELLETKSVLPMELGQTVKTLGIFWKPETDEFFFKIDNDAYDMLKVLTKRIILSQIAKIFDPIGWLAPVVIVAKMTMQSLWKLDLQWDEQVSEPLQQSWSKYREDLQNIESIHIPRCIKPTPDSKFALFGFCDASEKAYAGVVYLGVYPSNGHSPPLISFIASKTRVAPSKPVSLPRLELCGAVLLAQLLNVVKKSLNLSVDHQSAWTDSTVTLAWINGHPSKWKSFVANRVTEIQNLIPSSSWGHVAGVENPADCASRGLEASQLASHPLWWHGPPWLQNGFPSLALPDLNIDPSTNMEERKEVTCLRISVQPLPLLQNCSSLIRLQRVTAWIYRFINNCRSRIKNFPPSNPIVPEWRAEEVCGVGTPVRDVCGLDTSRPVPSRSTCGPLTPSEIDHSMQYWIKLVQRQEFYREIKCLEAKEKVSSKSAILNLNPFVDSVGILRVGGRIRKAQIGFEKKHPAILPRHNPFTRLLIIHFHEKYFHAGPQLLLSTLQSQFWIMRSRDAVRMQIRKCILCTKLRATTMQQQMGDLPAFRITPSRPFSKCSVDFAGPFLLKPMVKRSTTNIKAYICVFVCAVTRALHLEIVSNLSTDAFLASLRRFIARRGKPSEIFSDNGTNFVGAARELRELAVLFSSADHNNKVANQLSQDQIKWTFHPAAAPHFSGLVEAGVKSVKFHLRRVMGNSRLNYEELSTIVTQIEAVLNSRPLTPESSDPNDLAALTPGHFLIGAPLLAAPDPDLSHLNTGRLGRFQLIQQMYHSFWKRWSNEYITRLQQRPKWMSTQDPIKVDDLVIIKDENLPPLTWRMGRVMELHPGADGLVRVVTLRTGFGIVKRPIVKLCLLPVSKP